MPPCAAASTLVSTWTSIAISPAHRLKPVRSDFGKRTSRPAPARSAQRPHPGETVLDFLVIRMLVHRHHLAAIRATVLDLHTVSSPPRPSSPDAYRSFCRGCGSADQN